MNIGPYTTLVFDCDGVILDSNRVKTEAFRRAAMPYGKDAAEALVSYHVDNGGVSRYEKFEYFLSKIVPGRSGPDKEALLASYESDLSEALIRCDVAEGLEQLREATKDKRWLVVSGADERELRQLLRRRNIGEFFDGGVFGSPDSKDAILKREIETGRICGPALFLGDSRYDLEAARRAGIDFVFVSGWTEMAGWVDLVRKSGIKYVEGIWDLQVHP